MVFDIIQLHRGKTVMRKKKKARISTTVQKKMNSKK